mmetsp:Transcript_34351/g.50280  ORF Transcript_34351/g.50280 Transcript_34351/m.50280 type:complete len:178 (-) Transcript_34351:241-774(-)
MERLAALGLKIVTEEDTMARHNWSWRAQDAGGAETAPELPQPPPSPRMQVLLDSDILQALLASTLSRCLPPVSGCALEGHHSALFQVEVEEAAEEAPAQRQEEGTDPRANMLLSQLSSSRSFDESDTSNTCPSWSSRPDLSPTSAVWSDWETRCPPRKRGREDCDTDQGEWLSGRVS